MNDAFQDLKLIYFDHEYSSISKFIFPVDNLQVQPSQIISSSVASKGVFVCGKEDKFLYLDAVKRPAILMPK